MLKDSLAQYYQNIKKKNYQKKSIETGKGKKWQYCCEQFENLSENEKQKLAEYR